MDKDEYAVVSERKAVLGGTTKLKAGTEWLRCATKAVANLDIRDRFLLSALNEDSI